MVAMMYYSPRIQLLLIVCLALWALIIMLYVFLFAWYAWPTLQRILCAVRATLSQRLHCLWCWRSLHLLCWYPRCWPSHLCHRHRQQAQAQLAARQARSVRYHIETTPAAPDVAPVPPPMRPIRS